MSIRTALVTGSANGIGRAIALRLAQDGFQIAINDLASQELLIHSTNVSWQCGGVRTAVLTADISNEDNVANLIRNTSEMLGGIDVSMNQNADVKGGSKPILEISASEWDKVQAINVRGVFLCYKYAAQEMINQGRGGKLIGACSISGYRPVCHIRTLVNKWAVRGLTQAVAMDMAQHGITVNAHCPGMVRTDILMTAVQGEMQTPEDVAGLVRFLAGKDSDQITGQSLIVDGGVVFS
ncbi:uncharacterized protein BDZ83DRAFT_579435 [Colletotrichum acutatum]|uniref:NAD(P)-binding protein n=1 Tax=Glomerella acutata TaxID=27357 RepID=A0AAD8XEA9_GLOAC|nr:uncharacterized protein BDZ83DRAFT_579435 [Colletotrichum acutatum]KAK1724062.1 hypothetical protein BDZ83DRAFT_579435 [Colletotrichum acutatum]